jgi:ElaB/YqjD/DUF883 family membrane-anchored ribosome-binding protein
LSGKAQQLCANTTSLVRDATAENPFTTLAVVALAGFVMGALWSRGGRDYD